MRSTLSAVLGSADELPAFLKRCLRFLLDNLPNAILLLSSKSHFYSPLFAPHSTLPDSLLTSSEPSWYDLTLRALPPAPSPGTPVPCPFSYHTEKQLLLTTVRSTLSTGLGSADELAGLLDLVFHDMGGLLRLLLGHLLHVLLFALEERGSLLSDAAERSCKVI